MPSGRIFCPVRKEIFKLFLKGRKTVELRRASSPVAKQALKGLRLIEIRCGYGGRSIWGEVLGVDLYPSIDAVPSSVLERACVDRDGARELLGDGPVVAIHIRLAGDPRARGEGSLLRWCGRRDLNPGCGLGRPES